MKKIIYTLLTACLATAHGANLPAGWKMQTQQGFSTYTPENAPGVIMVIALAPLPIQGNTLDAWAAQVAATLSHHYGSLTWQEAALESDIWHASHRLDSKDGKKLFAQYFAKEEHGQGRIVVLLAEENEALLKAHGARATTLAGELLTQDIHAHVALAREHLAQRGHTSIHTGQPFVFGSYYCHIENGDYPYDIQLQLYDNGEYRVSSRKHEQDTYAFDPLSHTVNIASRWNLTNLELAGETEYIAIYFRDHTGKAMLYGEDLDEGEATLCEHTGEAQDPSPEAEQAAIAEARRFKWVTAPDQGVPMNAIEAIVHHAEHKNDSLGIRLEESHILLLKDGWAYLNLRVPPADLDIRASRDNEAGQWRRWKKEHGQYLLEKADSWEDIAGQSVRPAQPDERIAGAYSRGATYGNLYTSAHTFTDSLYFSADGTLSTASSVRGGTTALNSGTFSANVAADQQNTLPVRYHLDGYTLTRTYPDGSTTRSLVYFWGDGQKRIAINGATYNRSEKQ